MTRTHILPFFTRRDAQGREQSVCGRWVTAAELAPRETAPTCWGCAAYVEFGPGRADSDDVKESA